jgi:hypothetical protein
LHVKCEHLKCTYLVPKSQSQYSSGYFKTTIIKLFLDILFCSWLSCLVADKLHKLHYIANIKLAIKLAILFDSVQTRFTWVNRVTQSDRKRDLYMYLVARCLAMSTIRPITSLYIFCTYTHNKWHFCTRM